MQKHLPVSVFNEIKKTFAETKRDGFKTTVNARVVHEWLEVKTQYSKWIKHRIDKYGFSEGVDYCVVETVETPSTQKRILGNINNLQTITRDYHLAPDCIKQLAMIESSEKGRLARLYFLDCEVVAASKAAALEDRRSMAVEFRPMTDAVRADHDNPQPYHYSNESDMINRIVLGMTSAKFKEHHGIGKNDAVRDFMTTEQMAAIISLQRANTVFITMKMSFDDRKVKLRELFDIAHKEKMIEEIKLLES